MESILAPASFDERRAPLLEKVERDAEAMYRNARYVIALNDSGRVIEKRLNHRIDGEVVDCLAVFAPFTYRNIRLERVLVLEIGFRRFVPYAQTEHKLGASTRRGPIIRLRKGEERKEKQKIRRKKGKMSYVIKPRVPVASLTEDALFDLLLVLTEGIQECVDSIIDTWTKTVVMHPRGIWHRYEHESSIIVRFPEEAHLLCGTAYFADLEWRREPGKQLDSLAENIRSLLKGFTDRKVPHRHRSPDGRFSDDFVRRAKLMRYVAEKLKTCILYKNYSSEMIERILEFIGSPDCPERKLVDQICRLYKVPKAKKHPGLKHYLEKYGEMKDLLLERWTIRNYQSIKLKKRKAETALLRKEENKPYRRHAKRCIEFSVFASKEAMLRMVAQHDARKTALLGAEEITFLRPVTVAPNDDDVPWDATPAQKTGTDDEIPF